MLKKIKCKMYCITCNKDFVSERWGMTTIRCPVCNKIGSVVSKDHPWSGKHVS